MCKEPGDKTNCLNCVKCQKPVHKERACSRIKKTRLKKTMDGGTWRCINCREPDKKHGKIRSCKMCGANIRFTDDCYKCNECQGDIHKQDTCSGLTPADGKRVDRKTWRCKGCIQREEESEIRRKNTQHEPVKIEYLNQRKRKDKSIKPIKVLQWNADSIRNKREELCIFLKRYDIDLFLLQETKLLATDKTPSFPGYAILSKPRRQVAGCQRNRGGGLLIGIKEKIPYREVKDLEIRDGEDDITESQTIELPVSVGEDWRVTNIYIPSERTGDAKNSTKDTVVSTKFWPKGKNDLIAGDYNAHHSRWDRQLDRESNRRGLETKRGDMIDAWMQDTDMQPLNTGSSGSATHTNRKTASESSPDITIVNATERNKYDNWVRLTLNRLYLPDTYKGRTWSTREIAASRILVKET